MLDVRMHIRNSITDKNCADNKATYHHGFAPQTYFKLLSRLMGFESLLSNTFSYICTCGRIAH